MVSRDVRHARAREVLAILPWLLLFVGFAAAYAWARRDWMWIVGDDQNLMMPAIDIGRGLVPNIDFANGYPGLTFYIQRLIMLVVGDLPFSEHVYTAIQAVFFALASAWMLRGRIPATFTWILVMFVWTVSYRLNPTPNPGNVMQTLALLSLYWMDRFASRLQIRDAVIGGSLAGLAFLFKQPGIFLPVAFALYSSYAYLAWPSPPLSRRLRAAIIGANVVALIGFTRVYLGSSVFGVLSDPATRQSLLFSAAVFVGPWVVAVSGLGFVSGRVRSTVGPAWSLDTLVRANVAFVAGAVAVAGLGFVIIYGSVDRILTALRAVFFDSPQLINAADTKLLHPLLLWPGVAIAVGICVIPFLIGGIRSWVIRLALLGVAVAGCAYTALTYTDLQFTVAGALLVAVFAAVFLWKRPSDRQWWNRFFLFLGATCLLAYLVPHPKYLYSLGILVVSGWFMLGDLAPRRWPVAADVIGFAAVAAIALLTVRWANAEMLYVTEFQVGSHMVKSYDSAFPAAVAAANASSEQDWLSNTSDYLVYLAHAP